MTTEKSKVFTVAFELKMDSSYVPIIEALQTALGAPDLCQTLRALIEIGTMALMQTDLGRLPAEPLKIKPTDRDSIMVEWMRKMRTD